MENTKANKNKKYGAQIADGQGNVVILQGSKAKAITPDDNVEFPIPGTLYIGKGGNLTVVLADDDKPVTFKNLIDGRDFPHLVKKVMSTNTSCDFLLLIN